MVQPWTLVIDLGVLGICFLVIGVIRRFLPFLTKFRIPDAILAGFIGLIIGPSVLNILPEIRGSQLFQSDNLLALVYHLMAIGFIALALRSNRGKGRTRSAVAGGFYMVVSYAIQGLLGLGLTLIMMKTIFPDIFPSFGFLLPFGFAQGPSLAGATGKEWSTILNPATGLPAFPDGASVGLSFSTIGFLWACVVGIPLMNLLLRARKTKGVEAVGRKRPPARFMVEREREYTGLARSVDKTTTQLVLVGGIYALLFAGLEGLTTLLNTSFPGNKIVENVLRLFWGLQFAFGALMGTLIGMLIRKLKIKGWIKGGKIISNYHLQHIGGTCVDFMIAASIAAINIKVLGPYIAQILIVTSIGGLATIGYIWLIVKWVWPKTFVEHFVALFGCHTGTIATGMALLRGVDPDFRTSAASDMIYGSGIGLVIGVPLIIIAGFPAAGYELGDPRYYWWTLVAIFGYLVLALGSMWLFIVLSKHRKKELL